MAKANIQFWVLWITVEILVTRVSKGNYRFGAEKKCSDLNGTPERCSSTDPSDCLAKGCCYGHHSVTLKNECWPSPVTNLTFTLSDTKLPVNAALNASIMSHKGYGMQYEFVFNPAKKPSTSYTTNNNQDTLTFPGYARPGIYEVHLTGWNAVDRLTVRKNVSVFYELLNITIPRNMLCEVGQKLEFSFTVSPNVPHTLKWRVDSGNWTTGNIFVCETEGTKNVSVMAFNEISVVSSNCIGGVTAINLEVTHTDPALVNQTVAFTIPALTVPNVHQFQWSFGDGTNAITTSSLPITHTYTHTNANPGYNVTLTAVNQPMVSHTLMLKVFQVINPPLLVQCPQSDIGALSEAPFKVLLDSSYGAIFNWTFGDGITRSTTQNSITHAYSVVGTYGVTVTASNAVNNVSAVCNVKVAITVDGLGLVQLPVAVLGNPSEIAAEIHNGTDVNLTTTFGDLSPFVAIVNIGEVADLFVARYFHNYSTVGDYLVNISAYNNINRKTIRGIATVERKLQDLQAQVTYNTNYLEVNATATLQITVTGTNPEFIVNFGVGDTNTTTRDQSMMFSYVTQGLYNVSVTAKNNVSSVNVTVAVRVYKPVLPLIGLQLSSTPTNRSSPVIFKTKFDEASDFNCAYDLGDDQVISFCPNLVYYVDGRTADKTPFENVKFEVNHTYAFEGYYKVTAYCANRLHNATYTTFATVQQPIIDLQLPPIPPKIFGQNVAVPWSMTNGTNVTFSLYLNNALVYSSTKSAQGDAFTLTPSHYVSDSTFTVDLRAQNLVSQANLSIQLIIEIELLRIDFMALSTTSDFGTGLPGRGNDNNAFPTEFPVNLTVVPYPSNATNLTYSWDYGDAAKANTSEPTSLHQYSYKVDLYTVRVTAFNLVSQKVGQVTVLARKSVLKLAAESDAPSKRNNTMNFTLDIDQFGSDTCFTFDMGDDSGLQVFGSNSCANMTTKQLFSYRSESTTRIELSHIYTAVGVFMVHINATNTVSRQHLQLEAPVLELVCNRPEVAMQAVGKNTTKAKEIRRSEAFTLSNKAIVDCEASDATKFLWEVQQIHDDPPEYDPPRVLTSVTVSGNKVPDFLVPARILQYGLYQFKVTVTMVGYDAVYGTDLGYIKIVDTPFVEVKIAGGNMIRRGMGKNITMDGTQSMDTDVGPGNYSNMVFVWLCRNSSEPEFKLANISDIPQVEPRPLCDAACQQSSNASYENQGGCFGTGAGRLKTSDQKFELDTRRGMEVNTSYVVTLVVLKTNKFGVKTGKFDQLIETAEGDPPVTTAQCKLNCNSKVNIDQKLALQGSCSECYGRITFEWILLKYNSITAKNEDQSSQQAIPRDQTQKMLLTKIDFLNVAVKRDQLEKDTKYSLRLRAFRSSTVFGETNYVFITNSQPVNGTCAVTPLNGTAPTTTFTFTCNGWEDPDLPLSYDYGYYYRGLASTFYFGPESSASAVLPMGLEDNDFQLTLQLRILDRLGAATSLFINVTVMPQVASQANNTYASLSNLISGKDNVLQKSIQEGDLSGANQWVSSVSSVLNFMAREAKSAQDSGRNLTEEETKRQEEGLAERTKFRQTMITQLKDIEVASIVGIKQVAGAFSKATEGTDELSLVSQETALSTFKKLTSVLEGSSSASFQELEEGSGDLLSSIGNVLVASANDAKFQKADSTGNITNTGSNDTGSVSTKDRARLRSKECTEMVDNVSTVLLKSLVAGEKPVVILSLNLNISVEKQFLEDLGNSPMSDGAASFALPDLGDMGLKADENGTSKFESVDKKMSSVSSNPFTWHNSSSSIQSSVISLSLTNSSGHAMDTSNFSNPVNLFVPRDDSKITPPKQYNLRPKGDNEYMQYHSFEMTSMDNSIHVQIKPLNESVVFKVYLLFNERPSTEKFSHNWTLPDYSSCRWKNVSNIRTINVTENGTAGLQTVTYVTQERECDNDPHTLFVSNALVTELGLYYIGIYFKEPESPIDPPEHSRTRREVSCGGHSGGRSKRSLCVIIPPPPPTPPTPAPYGSSQYLGMLPANVDFNGNVYNPNKTLQYMCRVYSSNCLFWNKTDETWINRGCKVGPRTRPNRVHCQCTHLTSFGGDFLVAPNPIDFDKVFSADLSKNFVVLTVICGIFGLYLVAAVFARRADKKDDALRGATAVGSSPGYRYLVTVNTGIRQNAGTTANVVMVMSGDESETEPQALLDNTRPLFKRGKQNSFVLTSSKSLGHLSYIRIWHDNTGPSPSWYLSRVTVEDLQTDKRSFFICERWLAVEEDDGKVDRILPVASKKDLTQFGHLFVAKSVQGLSDGHLWFSVLGRPPRSTFTRVQRLSCCLCLLYFTMITSCMFYNVGGETNDAFVLKIGHLEIDVRAMIIGIQTSLIVFPVNLALVQIFRNIRPKEPKKPKKPKAKKKVAAETNLGLEPECDGEEEDFTDIANKTGDTPSIIDEPESKSSKKDKKRKKKGGKLHYNWIYFAWILCALSVVTCATFTVFYSLSWGPETSNEWLISFVTSFFQSVLVIQPVKVVMIAIVFSLIIKKPADDVDEDDKENKKRLDQKNSEVVHSTEELTKEDFLSKYGPPQGDRLQAARAQRLKEVAMVAIIRDIAAYFIFMLILLVVAYGNRDPNSYLMRKSLYDTFVVSSNDKVVDLATAADADSLWHWGRETLARGMYPQKTYNNKTFKLKGFMVDQANYLVGISRLRQVRVKVDSCKIEEKVRHLFKHCYDKYNVVDEETHDFDVAWKPINPGETISRRKRSIMEQFSFAQTNMSIAEFAPNFKQEGIRLRRAIEPIYKSTSGRQQRKKKRPGSGYDQKTYFVLEGAIAADGSIISCPTRWQYRSMLDIQAFPYWGKLALYNGGGYLAELGYDYHTALTVIADLHSHNWIDQQTRAVFVEFTVYNANVNLFGVAFMFIEFLPTGGAYPNAQFVISRFYNNVGPGSKLILACQILFVFFVVYFAYREFKAMYQQKGAYFHGFWNWMEVAMIVCQFTIFALFLGRLYQVSRNISELRYNPKDFVSFQYAAAADDSLAYAMGMLVFFVNLRFIKLLRFNKRMAMLGNTIRIMAKPISNFMLCFAITFIAFTSVAVVVFGIDNHEYSSFLAAFTTNFRIVLGDFDYHMLERANRLIGPVYFFAFMYFNVFYLMNMFLAIINDTFAEVKSDNDKQQNEYEMVEFIIASFKKRIGLGKRFKPVVSQMQSKQWNYKHRPDSILEDSDEERKRKKKLKCQRNKSLQHLENVASTTVRELDQFSVAIDENSKEEVQYELILLRLLMKAKAGVPEVDYMLLHGTPLPYEC